MESFLVRIEAVYRESGGDFFRLALAKTGDREQARDAVQEGFARAIRGRSTFRATGSLEAWVARCVMNAARDAARARSRRPITVEAARGVKRDSAGREPTTDPAVGAVRAAVARLPQRQRDALFLRHYLDFDYAAIAEALGVEVGTVSATLHAARARLADDLQEVAQ